MERRRRSPRIEVRDSHIHGKGLFALERIPRGTRILEYTGERITADEGELRYASTVPFHTLLFDLGNGTMIDGGVGGSDARFINHSCKPNCKAYVERGHIYIYADRAIASGAEVLLDYSFEPEDADDPEVQRGYPCDCRAPGCRRTMVRAA